MVECPPHNRLIFRHLRGLALPLFFLFFFFFRWNLFLTATVFHFGKLFSAPFSRRLFFYGWPERLQCGELSTFCSQSSSFERHSFPFASTSGICRFLSAQSGFRQPPFFIGLLETLLYQSPPFSAFEIQPFSPEPDDPRHPRNPLFFILHFPSFCVIAPPP